MKCLGRLELVIELGEGIWTNIWTTMGECSGSEPPAGLNGIDDRIRILKSSVEILSKALHRSKQEDVTSDTVLPINHKSSELGGKFLKKDVHT